MFFFHKRFNVQDFQYKAPRQLPFVGHKRQFTPSEVAAGKRKARAKTHIERVIGPLKKVSVTNHFHWRH